MKSTIIANTLEIMDVLPHRYPFLLVDSVIELENYKSCTGIKGVTYNEPQFQGHFPNQPIMPGVMLIEAMAQTSALMVLLPDKNKGKNNNYDEKSVYFVTIEKVKFRKPVLPGNMLRIETEKVKNRGSIWKFQGRIVIDNEIYTEATFTTLLKDR